MADSPAPPRKKNTILLVEDEEPLLILFRGILELAGYNVLYSRDGEIAARICEEHSSAIDLLVSDMIMPGKNGKDLSLFIHDRWPDIKILLFSGHPDSDKLLQELGELKHRVRFLSKPVTQDMLLRAVRVMLR